MGRKIADILKEYKKKGYKEIETNAYNDYLTDEIIEEYEEDDREYREIINDDGSVSVYHVDDRGYLETTTAALIILEEETDKPKR